jgi:hypothetical protein
MTIPLTTAPNALVIDEIAVSAGALPTGFSFIPATAGGGLLLPNGQTLTAGGVTTVDGMMISLSDGTTPVVVIDSSISITATTSTSRGLGGYTNTGLGGTSGPTSTTTGDAAEFTGSATTMSGICKNWWHVTIVGTFLCVLVAG